MKAIAEMSNRELCKASVSTDFPWGKAPYLEELCRRTGNLNAFRRDPEKAAKAAARGCGMKLI